MRIIRLEATNVKRLRAVAITPDGNVIRITGANGSGKTSLLDAIYWAFSGKKAITSKPVRSGEETATIRLELGTVTITRKFTAAGETSLIVESAEGARFPSPQRLLDDLFGELTFDPLAFSRADPKTQLETLRGLVKLDVDIDALDAANETDYQTRTGINRQIRVAMDRAQVLEQGVNRTMECEPIDVTALVEQMGESATHNIAIENEKRARTDKESRAFQLRGDIQGLTQEIEKLIHKRNASMLMLDAIEEEVRSWPTLPEPIDTYDLGEQIKAAQTENAHRAQQQKQRERHQAALDQLTALQIEAENLTDAMDERKAAKAAAIAGAAMPVPRLSFGEGEVLFNEIPFEQASTAEQIRVSMAIAMAANPKLRVVLIRDGSLLDAKSLAIVEQMAEEHDFQVFIESVSTDGSVGILLEEGQVAAIDGVAVRPEAELAEAVTGD